MSNQYLDDLAAAEQLGLAGDFLADTRPALPKISQAKQPYFDFTTGLWTSPEGWQRQQDGSWYDPASGKYFINGQWQYKGVAPTTPKNTVGAKIKAKTGGVTGPSPTKQAQIEQRRDIGITQVAPKNTPVQRPTYQLADSAPPQPGPRLSDPNFELNDEQTLPGATVTSDGHTYVPEFFEDGSERHRDLTTGREVRYDPNTDKYTVLDQNGDTLLEIGALQGESPQIVWEVLGGTSVGNNYLLSLGRDRADRLTNTPSVDPTEDIYAQADVITRDGAPYQRINPADNPVAAGLDSVRNLRTGRLLVQHPNGFAVYTADNKLIAWGMAEDEASALADGDDAYSEFTGKPSIGGRELPRGRDLINPDVKLDTSQIQDFRPTRPMSQRDPNIPGGPGFNPLTGERLTADSFAQPTFSDDFDIGGPPRTPESLIEEMALNTGSTNAPDPTTSKAVQYYVELKKEFRDKGVDFISDDEIARVATAAAAAGITPDQMTRGNFLEQSWRAFTTDYPGRALVQSALQEFGEAVGGNFAQSYAFLTGGDTEAARAAGEAVGGNIGRAAAPANVGELGLTLAGGALRGPGLISNVVGRGNLSWGRYLATEGAANVGAAAATQIGVAERLGLPPILDAFLGGAVASGPLGVSGGARSGFFDEPPVPRGHTRVYRGTSTGVDNTHNPFYTTNRSKAERYVNRGLPGDNPDGHLWYADIKKSELPQYRIDRNPEIRDFWGNKDEYVLPDDIHLNRIDLGRQRDSGAGRSVARSLEGNRGLQDQFSRRVGRVSSPDPSVTRDLTELTDRLRNADERLDRVRNVILEEKSTDDLRAWIEGGEKDVDDLTSILNDLTSGRPVSEVLNDPKYGYTNYFIDEVLDWTPDELSVMVRAELLEAQSDLIRAQNVMAQRLGLSGPGASFAGRAKPKKPPTPPKELLDDLDKLNTKVKARANSALTPPPRQANNPKTPRAQAARQQRLDTLRNDLAVAFYKRPYVPVGARTPGAKLNEYFGNLIPAANRKGVTDDEAREVILEMMQDGLVTQNTKGDRLVLTPAGRQRFKAEIAAEKGNAAEAIKAAETADELSAQLEATENALRSGRKPKARPASQPRGTRAASTPPRPRKKPTPKTLEEEVNQVRETTDLVESFGADTSPIRYGPARGSDVPPPAPPARGPGRGGSGGNGRKPPTAESTPTPDADAPKELTPAQRLKKALASGEATEDEVDAAARKLVLDEGGSEADADLVTDILRANRRITNAEQRVLNADPNALVRNVRAATGFLTGELSNPKISKVLHQMDLLRSALVLPKASKVVPGRRTLNALRNATSIKGGPGLDTKIASKIVKNQLEHLLTANGITNPKERAAVRHLFQDRRYVDGDHLDNWLVARTQEWKNTKFGLLDVGVFGVNLATALAKGGPMIALGSLNRLMGLMHLPTFVNTATVDANLPRNVRNILHGLHVGNAPSGVRADTGTLLKHIPGMKGVDRFVTSYVDAMQDIQFNKLLQWTRESHYEGNLMAAHLFDHIPGVRRIIGGSINDDVVRLRLARNSDQVTQHAEAALGLKRSALESATLTSTAYTRSQFQFINEMLRIANLKDAAPEERLVAATMAASLAGGVYMTGQLINSWLPGSGELEINPFDRDFGRATFTDPETGRRRTIDLFPQQQLAKALIQSTAALAEFRPEDIGEVFGRFALSRAGTPVGQALARLTNSGYDPERGFRIGDLHEGKFFSAGNLLQTANALVPSPPVIQNKLQGETGSSVTGSLLTFSGWNTYDNFQSYLDINRQWAIDEALRRGLLNPDVLPPGATEDYNLLGPARKIVDQLLEAERPDVWQEKEDNARKFDSPFQRARDEADAARAQYDSQFDALQTQLLNARTTDEARAIVELIKEKQSNLRNDINQIYESDWYKEAAAEFDPTTEIDKAWDFRNEIVEMATREDGTIDWKLVEAGQRAWDKTLQEARPDLYKQMEFLKENYPSEPWHPAVEALRTVNEQLDEAGFFDLLEQKRYDEANQILASNPQLDFMNWLVGSGGDTNIYNADLKSLDSVQLAVDGNSPREIRLQGTNLLMNEARLEIARQYESQINQLLAADTKGRNELRKDPLYDALYIWMMFGSNTSYSQGSTRTRENVYQVNQYLQEWGGRDDGVQAHYSR